jgi:hypothetical protein
MPSSRDGAQFVMERNGASSTCALILDMSDGAPLFSGARFAKDTRRWMPAILPPSWKHCSSFRTWPASSRSRSTCAMTHPSAPTRVRTSKAATAASMCVRQVPSPLPETKWRSTRSFAAAAAHVLRYARPGLRPTRCHNGRTLWRALADWCPPICRRAASSRKCWCMTTVSDWS